MTTDRLSFAERPQNWQNPTPHTPHPTPHTLPPRKTFSAAPI
ncbi:hypothetical protein N0824_02496 [Microcystis sp. 0824]|nr:hypothetical protein N0824_02496 [Microcystis sp. 0824]